MNIEIASNLH